MKLLFRVFIIWVFVCGGSKGLLAHGPTAYNPNVRLSTNSRLCGVNSLYLALKTIGLPQEYSVLLNDFPSARDTGVSLGQMEDYLKQKKIPCVLAFYSGEEIKKSSTDIVFLVLTKTENDYHIFLAKALGNDKIQIMDRDQRKAVQEVSSLPSDEKYLCLAISKTPLPQKTGQSIWHWICYVSGSCGIVGFCVVLYRKRKARP